MSELNLEHNLISNRRDENGEVTAAAALAGRLTGICFGTGLIISELQNVEPHISPIGHTMKACRIIALWSRWWMWQMAWGIAALRVLMGIGLYLGFRGLVVLVKGEQKRDGSGDKEAGSLELGEELEYVRKRSKEGKDRGGED
ncbi:hypothetical protein PVK06_010339 [Gossypium arboreum]|uniref:Uncharacterized protein n=1 Tax=Gossypium arboreum TaxID=29729 RepID=A0ABR0Q6N5_GOSAR|nr:hypothetical protein PVK06_010339 [Gossypium arboreum]